MSQSSGNMVLFGFDLRLLGRWVNLAWSQLLLDSSSILSERFRPPLWVLHHGGWLLHTVGKLSPINAPSDTNSAEGERYYAVSISADNVLFKRICLPASSEMFLSDAVALEVDVCSPFPAAQVLSGYTIIARNGSTIDVILAITTLEQERKALEGWDSRSAGPTANKAPQVCAVFENQWLVELDGRPHHARQAAYFRKLEWLAQRMGAAVLGLILVAAVPAASSWYRARQLVEEYSQLREKAESIDESIDRLHYQRAVITAIAEDVERRQNYALWLANIAGNTPDGTYYERMVVEDLDVQVMGYSDNAANYLKSLTEQDRYATVTARSAFVRDSRSGQERFNIEWSLVPNGE